MSIEVDREDTGDVVVLTVGGSVDIYSSSELRAQLKVALDEQAKTLVVDLARVTFIDSSGLATLIEALQRIQRHEGTLLLCSLTSAVRGVFELANLHTIFDIRPDRDAALGG